MPAVAGPREQAACAVDRWLTFENAFCVMVIGIAVWMVVAIQAM